MINPVISYTLDSRLMEGNTYLEHSAPGVYLDSGPTEGGDKPGSGHYPGRSTYGRDYLPGAFGSRGVSGQWTHGRDVAYGTIGAISARSMGGRATGGDKHTRASSSGITDRPRTGMFYIVVVANMGYCSSLIQMSALT